MFSLTCRDADCYSGVCVCLADDCCGGVGSDLPSSAQYSLPTIHRPTGGNLSCMDIKVPMVYWKLYLLLSTKRLICSLHDTVDVCITWDYKSQIEAIGVKIYVTSAVR